MSAGSCIRCGGDLPSGAQFCPACGTPVDNPVLATDTLPAISLDAPPGVPLLVVTRGANAGSRFALDQPVTRIGRHPEAEIFLDDVTVSRAHAEVRRDGDRLVVRDMGSLNGTYLNGALVEAVDLREGDRLQIGKYHLLLVIGE